MSDVNPIKLMLVDDHAVVRQGLHVFLKTIADFELVGEASGGHEAIRLCRELRPDVILMDLVMPDLDGISATEIIREEFPDTQIIALTSFNDDKERVPNALHAGAIGFLFKDISVDDLEKAIRMAHAGEPVLSPEATRMLIQASTEHPSPTFNLSDRELDVLGLLIQGLNNPQIAEELVISRSTVKFHVSSILAKMGVESRTEAVAIAVQNNLVT
jgi:NarL family two-component system response regulator LiaR